MYDLLVKTFLSEMSTSLTLRLIIIEDGSWGEKWVQEAFDKVKEEYNAANIEWEQEGDKYLYLKL